MCVTLDEKFVKAPSKIIRVSASQALGMGAIRPTKKGSLREAIKKGLVEIPPELRNTRFAYGPLPHEIEAAKKRGLAKEKR